MYQARSIIPQGKRFIWPNDKPPFGARLNRRHPLARRLVGAWVMNEGAGNRVIDLSGNDSVLTLDAGILWKPGGLRGDGTTKATTGNAEPLQVIMAKTDEYTALVKFSVISRPAFLSTQFGMMLKPFNIRKNGNQVEPQFYQGGTNYNLSSGVNVLVGETATVAFSAKSGEQKVYVNSLFAASNNIAGAPSYGFGGDIINIGHQTDGIIYYAYLYNRILSQLEITELHRDPYQMFQPAIDPALFYYETPSGLTILDYERAIGRGISRGIGRGIA